MNINVKPLYIDILCGIMIIIFNPLSHFITLSVNIFTPDTIAYATMARDFIDKGLLYIFSWGHIDQGLILPPLYPFLVFLGRFFSPETLNIAEYVSSICALVSTIPIFLFLKHMANRVVAVITTVLIQINYYYFLIGMRPLTEATFLLTLSFTLYLMIVIINSNLEKGRKIVAFGTGVLICLVFLSRQIGIIVSLFVAVILFYHWCTISESKRKILNKNMLFMLLGWMIIFVPYAIILYVQTGHHPLTQEYRQKKYMITVEKSDILRDIDENRTLPPELVKQIESAPDSDYGLVYAERRRMRKLLPDASEMYSHINIDRGENARYLSKIASNFISPKKYIVKIYNNIVNLSLSLGKIQTALFLLAILSSLLIKCHKTRFTARLLLPLFIIFYLISISIITDKVSRYIYVIFPFCIMHISIELYIFWNYMADVLKIKRISGLFPTVFLIFIILLTTPGFFTGLTIIPKPLGIESGLHFFKKYIDGEPVFSLQPYYSYVSGGTFRILPDDSLAKVAKYGKNTGVRWLLIVRNRSIANSLSLYSNLQWYFERSLDKYYPDIVDLRAVTSDGTMSLYEIL